MTQDTGALFVTAVIPGSLSRLRSLLIITTREVICAGCFVSEPTQARAGTTTYIGIQRQCNVDLLRQPVISVSTQHK